MALRNFQILYQFVLRRKNAPRLGRKWCIFPCVIQNTTLKCEFVVQQISQGYIFRILQHFATNLCNFTNFKMLFLAVVMDFVFLAQIKIKAVAGIIHCNMLSYNILYFHLQLKHYLQHNFGTPYDENYYNGDWMMGPNFFCRQPFCMFHIQLYSYGFFKSPSSYAELEETIAMIMKHKTSIERYRYCRLNPIIQKLELFKFSLYFSGSCVPALWKKE